MTLKGLTGERDSLHGLGMPNETLSVSNVGREEAGMPERKPGRGLSPTKLKDQNQNEGMSYMRTQDPPKTCHFSMPSCVRSFSMSLTRSQVVFSSNEAVLAVDWSLINAKSK